MYEIFEKLMRDRGVRAVDVSAATGIRTGVLTDWKKGRYTPKADKLQKIADYFGVSLRYLTTGEEALPEDAPGYYLDPDARDLADFLHRNPGYKVLFDATRKVKPEDIEFVRQLIDRMSE